MRQETRPVASRIVDVLRITFDVGGQPAEFRWNPMTGSTTLAVDGHTQRLQSGLDPRSHYSLSTSRQWHRAVNGHNIIVTMDRPRVFAGLRPKDFTVEVDGSTVESTHGF
jgi:hypothetical protein